MYDVVIVGAGTAGLHLARLLKDLDVLVLERKNKIGEKACSGLYSRDIEKFVKIPEEAVENKISNMVLRCGEIELDMKIKQKPKVVDRKVFNKYLAEGVNVNTGESLNSFEIGDNIKIKTEKQNLESKLLVGADGGNSLVRNTMGIRPQELVNGLIGYVDVKDNSDFVEVWVDKNFSKDGFFWKIPRGERVEYGVLGSGINFRALERFFGRKDFKKEAAVIPAGFHRTFFDRCLLLGDAACQTKPWSLGGVLYGFVAGCVAANIIRKSLEDPSEKNLEVYEKGWKEKLWDSIQKGLLFREIFKDLDNKQVEEMFGHAKNLEELDMDHPFTF